MESQTSYQGYTNDHQNQSSMPQTNDLEFNEQQPQEKELLKKIEPLCTAKETIVVPDETNLEAGTISYEYVFTDLDGYENYRNQEGTILIAVLYGTEPQLMHKDMFFNISKANNPIASLIQPNLEYPEMQNTDNYQAYVNDEYSGNTVTNQPMSASVPEMENENHDLALLFREMAENTATNQPMSASAPEMKNQDHDLEFLPGIMRRNDSNSQAMSVTQQLVMKNKEPPQAEPPNKRPISGGPHALFYSYSSDPKVIIENPDFVTIEDTKEMDEWYERERRNILKIRRKKKYAEYKKYREPIKSAFQNNHRGPSQVFISLDSCFREVRQEVPFNPTSLGRLATAPRLEQFSGLKKIACSLVKDVDGT